MEIDYISPAPGTLVRSHGGRQPAASHARVGEVSVWFYFEAGMYELCTRGQTASGLYVFAQSERAEQTRSGLGIRI